MRDRCSRPSTLTHRSEELSGTSLSRNCSRPCPSIPSPCSTHRPDRRRESGEGRPPSSLRSADRGDRLGTRLQRSDCQPSPLPDDPRPQDRLPVGRVLVATDPVGCRQSQACCGVRRPRRNPAPTLPTKSLRNSSRRRKHGIGSFPHAVLRVGS